MRKEPPDNKPIQIKPEAQSPPSSLSLSQVFSSVTLSSIFDTDNIQPESSDNEEMSMKAPEIDKLKDASNYRVWSLQMNAILELKDLAFDLDKCKDGSSDVAKARKAYNEILLRVDADNINYLDSVAKNDSVKALHELKRRHTGDGVMPTLEILQQVLTLRLDSKTAIQSHIDKIRDSYKQLALKKVELPEIMQVANLMISLPDDYQSVMALLIQQKEEDLKFETVASVIQNEHRLITMRQKTKESEVASAANKFTKRDERKKTEKCTFCGIKGHLIDVCYRKHGFPEGYKRPPPKPSAIPRKHQSSHFSVEEKAETSDKAAQYASAQAYAYSTTVGLPVKSAFKRLGPAIEKASRKPKLPKTSLLRLKSVIIDPKVVFKCLPPADDVVDAFVDEAEMKLMNKSSELYALFTSHSRNSRQVPGWLLDSGASAHMSYNINLFTDLRHGEKGFITIANGSRIPIRGIGKVKILVGPADNQLALMLNDVAYAPDLHVNLLSVKQLNDSHNAILFANGKASLKVGDDFIEFASFQTKNFMVSESKIQSAYPCVHEWHRRMAHRNLGDIRELKKHGMTITRCNCVDQCDACMKGKTPNLPFYESEKPSSPLDIIVSDVNGPLPPTVGGSRYFMVFVDINTDFTVVKFLKHKSEAKNHVKNFIEFTKTQLNKKMKVFRSDGGGEYVNQDLQEYLASEGVKFETTIRHSPQSNGVAERKMRTLNDAVRTLLIASELPTYLWAEAMHNVVYTQNRIIRANQKHSPIELFMGRKARAEFIEFGRPVYVTTLKQGRAKYDPHAEIMRFLSVDDHQKGFRLWNGKKVIVERNVKPKTNVTISYTESMTQHPLETDEPSPQNIAAPAPEPMEPRRSKRIAEKQRDKSPEVANVSSSKTSLDPTTYKQATASCDREAWLDAMHEELNSLKNTGTYILSDLPPHKTAVGCKTGIKQQSGVQKEARNRRPSL